MSNTLLTYIIFLLVMLFFVFDSCGKQFYRLLRSWAERIGLTIPE